MQALAESLSMEHLFIMSALLSCAPPLLDSRIAWTRLSSRARPTPFAAPVHVACSLVTGLHRDDLLNIYMKSLESAMNIYTKSLGSAMNVRGRKEKIVGVLQESLAVP